MQGGGRPGRGQAGVESVRGGEDRGGSGQVWGQRGEGAGRCEGRQVWGKAGVRAGRCGDRQAWGQAGVGAGMGQLAGPAGHQSGRRGSASGSWG